LGRIGPSSAGQALVNLLWFEGRRDLIEKDGPDRWALPFIARRESFSESIFAD
jgi:hypothetical protein